MLECLHYSPQSQLDLDEIYDFFAIERDNPELGARIVADIFMAVKDIPGHPDRFPPVGPLPLTQDFYRFVRVGAYLVFFRAEGESIYDVEPFEDARNLDQHCGSGYVSRYYEVRPTW